MSCFTCPVRVRGVIALDSFVDFGALYVVCLFNCLPHFLPFFFTYFPLLIYVLTYLFL